MINVTVSKRHRLNRAGITVLVGLALLLLPACATRHARRSLPPGETVDHRVQCLPDFGAYRPTQNGKPVAVAGRDSECLEKYTASNFWLGHVELTEYGTYQDHRQMPLIERAVEQDTHQPACLFKKGIAIVVFVHGWFNNDDEQNGNLNSFRDLLAQVAAEEKTQGRGVLGIYLSWRGASVQAPLLKYLTYWGRARTADTIGQGIMVEALARIKNIHWLVAKNAAGRGGRSDLQIYQNSRLVLAGHSFGGRALYDAVAEGMETNFLQPYWAARSFPQAEGKGRRSQATMRRVTGFGDLVLLINPAIKSLPYRKVHYAVHSNGTVNYDPKQPVLMMVLSAKNDYPNHTLLPVGETLGNRFRDQFACDEDRKAAAQNTTALGHWKPFHTHELEMKDGRLLLTRNAEFFKAVDGSDDGERYPQPLPIKTLRSDRMPLQGIDTQGDPGLLPYMVISATSDIINGHSGFWPTDGNRNAYQFVTSFIAAQNKAVGAAREAQAATAKEKVLPSSF